MELSLLTLPLNSRLLNLKYEGYFQNTFSVSTETVLLLHESVRAVVICPMVMSWKSGPPSARCW